MKSYNKPEFEFVKLTVEEKFAGGSVCQPEGYCTLPDGSVPMKSPV